MDFILDAIDAACAKGAPFPALVTALTVPDIAGAVDAPGTGSQARYANWINAHFGPRVPHYLEHRIDGHVLYALRCKLLHEGLSDPSQAPSAQNSAVGSQKRLVAFNIGPGFSLHLCSASDATGDSWTILRAETFCADMTSAARAWIILQQSNPSALQR